MLESVFIPGEWMNTDCSTLSLIERAREGDHKAFSLLLDGQRRRLSVLVHYRLGPELRRKVPPEDVVQETYLRAVRDYPQFEYRGPGSFLAWLAQISQHVIADQARRWETAKRKASAEVALEAGKGAADPPRDPETPSRLLLGEERLRQILSLMDQLPDQYREVLLLSRFEGLTTGEIANRRGIPRSAVSLQLHRALSRLRELLAREEKGN